MTLILYILCTAGIFGAISLVMSYDHLSRRALYISIFSVVIMLLIFMMWSIEGGGFANIAAEFQTPDGSKRLRIWVIVITLITILTLFRDGTIFWVWRRLHPKSAPTDRLRANDRGSGIRQHGTPMPSSLMGSATSMFKNSELDIRTIALIRLAFAVFSKTDRSTIIGVENFLRLGDGRKYRTYQHLVAEILDSKTTLKDIIHPYWRAINGNSATARIMFADLCRLAKETGNLDKRTINNLIKVGRELGLSQEDMQRAL